MKERVKTIHHINFKKKIKQNEKEKKNNYKHESGVADREGAVVAGLHKGDNRHACRQDMVCDTAEGNDFGEGHPLVNISYLNEGDSLHIFHQKWKKITSNQVNNNNNNKL